MIVLRRIKNLAKYELMFLGFLVVIGMVTEKLENSSERV